MAEDDTNRRAGMDTQEWLARAPRVADALKKGAPVAISMWSGREISGLVCDREQNGLLVDVRDADGDSAGYVFLPWSSIEQVAIQSVAHRRVKFLPT
jgi:hypothetical protein